MKILGFVGRFALSFILIFQFSIGTAVAAAGDGSFRVTNSYLSSDQYPLRLLKSVEQIQDGTFTYDIKGNNWLHLFSQRVEIYQNGKLAQTISLNDPSIETLDIFPPSLKPRYNLKTKELIFEGKKRAEADGSGGELIARHVISGLDVVAMDYDSELLMLIDRKGRLYAVDMGFAVSQAFKAPIPVFDNLWAPKKDLDLKAGEVTAQFLTRGVRPTEVPLENLDPAETVLPHDKNGKVDYSAGGLLVRYNENGSEKVVGLFARDVTADRIAKAWAFVGTLGSITKPTKEYVDYYQQNKDRFEQMIQMKADGLIEASQRMVTPLRFIDINQLKNLSSRIDAFEGSKTQPRDNFDFNEWAVDFDKISRDASDAQKLEYLAQQAKKYSHQGVTDARKKLHRDLYNEFFQNADAQKRLETPDGLARAWQAFMEPIQSTNPYSNDQTKSKTLKSERATEWKILGAATAAITAYTAGAFVYSGFEFQQVQFLAWLYDNIYTQSMLDLAYRIPLSKHLLAWTFSIPTLFATSIMFGKIFDVVGSVYKNSNTAMGNFVREFQKTWGGAMGDFQRLVTVGLRSYSFIVYPYLRIAVEKLLSQKAFLSAYENNLNPLKVIQKDSELGREMGLTKNEFLGVMDPYLDAKHEAPVVERKKKMQAALKQQNQRLQSLAWMLASVVVAQKNEIDPATLLQVSESKLTPDELRDIFNNPEKHREWELLSFEIEKDLRSKNALTLKQEVSQLSPESIAEYFAAAKEAAAKIRSHSEFHQKATLRWRKIRSAPINALNFVFLENGKADATFLRSLIADRFSSTQIYQGFRNDQIINTVITAFWGGRADLAQPSHLIADPKGFMWTSPPGNYEMFSNVTDHFLTNGATLALVYQKLQAQQETRYLPKETFTHTSEVRPEGLWKGIKDWVSFGYNEIDEEKKPNSGVAKAVHYAYNLGTEADIGGIMAKRGFKKLNTLQANLTMSLALRMSIGGQTFTPALSGWAVTFALSQWAYVWLWDVIQRGNQMIDGRIEKNDAQFESAKFKIHRGLKESNLQMAQEGYDEMVKLFRKYNPQAIGAIEKTLNENFRKTLGMEPTKISKNEMEYMGLIVNLAKAHRTQNQLDFDRNIELLRKVLIEKQGFDASEITKLNALSLLEFSVTNPPVYTHPNRFLSETFSLSAGVATTLMYLPVSILGFEDVSVDPLNLAKWVMISLGLYMVAWGSLGKTPWLYYEKVYNKIRTRFVDPIANQKAADQIWSGIKGSSRPKVEAAKPPVSFIPANSCISMFQ